MTLTLIALTPLEPGQRTVMRLDAVVPSIFLLSIRVTVGMVAQMRLGWPAWPSVAVAGALALWTLVLAPRRRWAA